MGNSTSPNSTALVTGLTGQDGYYLSRLLADHGVTVHGISGPEAKRGPFVVAPRIMAHGVPLSDEAGMYDLINEVSPDYVFHLAGMSSVAGSWAAPVDSVSINALSTTTLLNACLQVQERSGKPIRVINASSGEIFAGSGESPQTESTPIRPTSPYGASKVLGHMMCHIYRTRGLSASNAILYNHESPRRGEHFVTRKITLGVAAIVRGDADSITLGNVAARRDFGWAPDYVEALYRMAVRGDGGDFVIATGVSHSILEFAEAAFTAAGVDNWQDRIRTDSDLLRPNEPADMVGDATRAAEVLDWRPTTTFDQIAAQMVEYDLTGARQPQSALGGTP
jgi:GDPmannose 4,6-dehydratase